MQAGGAAQHDLRVYRGGWLVKDAAGLDEGRDKVCRHLGSA